MPNKFYAYSLDGKKGIVDSWDECKAIVHGRNASFKSFKTRKEAEDWLNSFSQKTESKEIAKGIYFDAGTGRGNGVEISVTDENGKNLLDKSLDKKLINIHGKHLVPGDVTNNYGELLACYHALKISLDIGNKFIFGDSKLIIDYWSKGDIKIDSEKTKELAIRTSLLRKEFEKNGGKIIFISGDLNPADLGFHR